MKSEMSKTLGKMCAASVAELRKMGEFHRTDDDDGAGFTMVRRGGRVLGIAHTDVSSQGPSPLCRRGSPWPPPSRPVSNGWMSRS